MGNRHQTCKNKEQNGRYKYTLINDYINCKWIKHCKQRQKLPVESGKKKKSIHIVVL